MVAPYLPRIYTTTNFNRSGDEMSLTRKILVLFFALIVGVSRGIQKAPAQGVEGGAEKNAAEKEQQRQTREQMAARWKKLRAFERVDGEEKEVDRVQEPIFT